MSSSSKKANNAGTPQPQQRRTDLALVLTPAQQRQVAEVRTTNSWGCEATDEVACTYEGCGFTVMAFHVHCDAGHSRDCDKIPHLLTLSQLLPYPLFSLKNFAAMASNYCPMRVNGVNVSAQQMAKLLLYILKRPLLNKLVDKVRELVPECEDLSGAQERDMTKKMKKFCMSCLTNTTTDLLADMTESRKEQAKRINYVLSVTPTKEIYPEVVDQEEMLSSRLVVVQGSLGNATYVNILKGKNGEDLHVVNITPDTNAELSIYAQAIGIWLVGGQVKIGKRRNAAAANKAATFVSDHLDVLTTVKSTFFAADRKARSRQEKSERRRKRAAKKAAKKAAAEKHKLKKKKNKNKKKKSARKHESRSSSSSSSAHSHSDSDSDQPENNSDEEDE